METTIFIAGSGGHGIQNAGKSIIQAALMAGKKATCLPKYGIEKRGGFSSCYLVISDGEIGNPRKSKSDIVVVIDERAYNLFRDTVREDGYLIVNSSNIHSDEQPEGNITRLDFPIIGDAMKLGDIKSISTITVGMIMSVPGLLDNREEIKEYIVSKYARKPAVAEMNKIAFECGVPYGELIKLKKLA